MADPCSFSSFTRCVTKHLNLNLHVDFDRHVIRGRVALTVEALQDRFSSLVSPCRCPADQPRFVSETAWGRSPSPPPRVPLRCPRLCPGASASVLLTPPSLMTLLSDVDFGHQRPEDRLRGRSWTGSALYRGP